VCKSKAAYSIQSHVFEIEHPSQLLDKRHLGRVSEEAAKEGTVSRKFFSVQK
jgi:hypothetical protein